MTPLQDEHAYTLAKPDPDDRAVAIWLLITAGMIFAMALIGAITRLTESGLSIMEWAPVAGILPPLSTAEWKRVFALYQQIPEFKVVNPGMTLEEFKTIYWWEYIHRLWGRLIGVFFLGGYLWLFLKGRIRRELWPHLLAMFVLGGLQGVLGWIMVASGFADRTDVSQYRLVAHLMAALVIYGYIVWVATGLLRPHPRPSADPRWRALKGQLTMFGILVLVTIASGGFVAGLDAGLIYNTFPTMDGAWVPLDYGELEPFYLNFFENIAAVQFNHRLLAIVTVVLALLLWAWGRWLSLAPEATAALDLVACFAVIQVALGIITLLMVVPLSVAVLHQAGAIALLTAVIWALRQLPRAADEVI
jgi:cytochrome c oxidase assembly protein subunit 15